MVLAATSHQNIHKPSLISMSSLDFPTDRDLTQRLFDYTERLAQASKQIDERNRIEYQKYEKTKTTYILHKYVTKLHVVHFFSERKKALRENFCQLSEKFNIFVIICVTICVS